jgi:hypothetical protein
MASESQKPIAVLECAAHVSLRSISVAVAAALS